MARKRKEGKDPFYKVGVKLLTDAQLANIFPNYKNLMEKIEIYRSEVGLLGEEYRRQDQYNLMYDNVFSIMGKRGTGKTSVAFTLKQKIEKDGKRHGDIVLPIIIPEMIPNECSMLVWILAIVKEKVKDLEDELDSFKIKEKKGGYWDNCRYEEGKSYRLSQKVEDLMQLLFAGKYNPANEPSFYKAVGNSIKQAGDHYRFSCEVAKLWDEWVETIKLLYKIKKGEDRSVCPLIYFIFDDVDLEPQKVAELLSVIIKYLSHPNIIVITTADEELFLEVIANSMDRDMGRLPKEWRGYLGRKVVRTRYWEEEIEEQPGNDLITQTARMYLGKVLPTSTRYYLRLFGRAEDKRWFRLSESEYLGDSMCQQVDDLLRYTKEDKRRNFMKVGEEILNFYLAFMGDTSRQIGNAYLGWKEFMSNMMEEAELATRKDFNHDICIDRIYNACRYFLYVGINANHELAGEIEHIDDFISEVFWMEFNEWKLFVNYTYLSDFLDRMCKEKRYMKSEKLIGIALKLFSLLLLVENILLVMEGCIEGGITGRGRVHGVYIMMQFLEEHVFDRRVLFRNGMETADFFMHYSTLLDKLDYIVLNDDRNGADFSKEYLYSFVDRPYQDNDVGIVALSRMMRENREWLGEIAGMLAMVYGNAYVIGEKEINVCAVYADEKILSCYQKRVKETLLQQMQKHMEYFHLRKKAEERMKELKVNVRRQLWTERDGFENFCETLYEDLTRSYSEKMQENQVFYVTMEDIIRSVFKKTEEMSFSELLSYCPEELIEDLKEKIVPMLYEQESVEEALLVFKNKIEEWDFYKNELSIFDISAWLEKLRSIGGGNPQIERFVDRLLRSSEEDEQHWSDGARTILYNTDYYGTLKGLSMMVLEKELEDNNRYLETENYILSSMMDLFSDVDVAIKITDKEKYRDAVSVGMAVLLEMKFQQIYLDQTILKRYKNGYRLSSAGLEKIVLRSRHGINDNRTGRETYYYRLFLSMAEVLEHRKERPVLSVLSSFLSQATKRERRKYLDSLMKGETNEQISH